jgi:predicted nucleic acid-binding Zn ribbon protein
MTVYKYICETCGSETRHFTERDPAQRWCAGCATIRKRVIVEEEK